MVTDSHDNFTDYFDDSAFINEVATPNSDQSPDPYLTTQLQSLNDTPEIEFLDDHKSDSAFKFLNGILMDENIDETPSMVNDPVALLVTEKSFYDVIQLPSIDESIQSSLTSSQPLLHIGDGSSSNSEGKNGSFMSMNLVPSQFSDGESKLQFWKGVEEARKFLPTNSVLGVDLDEHTLASNSKGRKQLHRQDSDIDKRSSKQSVVNYQEEVELSELFDNIFLRDFNGLTVSSKGVVKILNKNNEGVVTVSSKSDIKFVDGIDKYWQQNRLPRVPRNGQFLNKTKGEESDDVYLENLLLRCAEAGASCDLQDAQEQLKQIRHYASSTGDACQRLANVFANGLEARFSGTGEQVYDTHLRNLASEKLKAYEVYHSVCPFKEISTAFANNMILKTAAKCSTLHIVDFGIAHGFQWAVFIQFLSIRQGGPPKLRITGIDFPQPGFRPAELIEETGQRLAKHCKRFNIPFEYQAIARQSWEAMDINDLKLARDEVLVVNCFLKFHNLPEETELAENPKDGVLKLIRSMKPDLFVHSILNGSFNAPFFLTRFRESFAYYGSLFDMFDVTLPHNNPQRLIFEKQFYGREVVNIIACEGNQRVVRPETYKQWQIRSVQAGFKILPLKKDIMLKGKWDAGYHKDFLLDGDCNWMLQGWKGHVLYGSSCWVSV